MTQSHRRPWRHEAATALTLALGLACVPAAAEPTRAAPPTDKVSDALTERVKKGPADKIDVIVTFEGRPGAMQHNAVAQHGGAVKREFQSIPGMALSLPAQAVEALSRRGDVEYVTLDMPVELHGKPPEDRRAAPPATPGRARATTAPA